MFCGAPFQPVALLGAGNVSVPPALISATSRLAPFAALVLVISVPLASPPKTSRYDAAPVFAVDGVATAIECWSRACCSAPPEAAVAGAMSVEPAKVKRSTEAVLVAAVVQPAAAVQPPTTQMSFPTARAWKS